jgi:dipeptidyl aminopeptidase/acylaminoacyl peptidase
MNIRTPGGRANGRKKVDAYGTWPSPIGAEAVGGATLRLQHVQAVGPWVYWTEGRPSEGGRAVLMRARSSGRPEDLLPVPFSARSRIHEYGGGEFLVANERIYFVNDRDQQVHETRPGGQPRQVTRQAGTRFADFAFDARRQRLIAAAERHADGAHLPENLLVAVSLAAENFGQVRDLVRGQDFYAAPRLSPDGAQLAYLTWSLPGMPWDEAMLMISDVAADGSASRPRRIAGGKGAAVTEPVWLPDGRLLYLSDRTGYDNLYVHETGKRPRALHPRAADFGRPLWNLGNKSFAVLAPNQGGGQIGASFLERGEARFGLIDVNTGEMTPLVLPLRSIEQVVAHGDGFMALATRDQAPPALVDISLKSAPRVIRSASPVALAKGMISRGRVLEITGAGGMPIYGLYYAPINGLWQAPRDARPPAIVMAHGGPTASADRGLKLKIQYWTSRGFAVLDVDYAGSTGYGRAYRRRLEGHWGVQDVADMIAAGDHLEREGLADGARLVISGGSAGGYTVLMTLAASRRFAVGSCSYGISDLSLLLAHTHKFESGYLHRLMGTTPDDWQATFEARSPIALADQIAAPLILFQGREDKVVPPEQSRLISERLMRTGVTTEYWEFDGEGHGFRRAGTIATVLERELAFFTRVLKIRPMG